MKKTALILLMTGLLGNLLFAQPVLTYEMHALKAGADNPMSYCKYLDPGQAGANVIWDFRTLEFERSFTGFLKDARETSIGRSFNRANTDLDEFGAHFYFHVNSARIEQYGYSSADGKVQTRYTVPFIKMEYPFTYGDNFTGGFQGVTLYSGIERGTFSGNYSVEADGFGTLLLPGGISYENTLRVRTQKSYTNALKNASQKIEVITYRWYNDTHRYPLLVLTVYSVGSGEKVSMNYQAAYNNQAVSSLPVLNTESIRIYPNPATDQLFLEFNGIYAGELNMTVLDAAGKMVRSFRYEVTSSGMQCIDLSREIEGLRPASYVLSIQTGDKVENMKFILAE